MTLELRHKTASPQPHSRDSVEEAAILNVCVSSLCLTTFRHFSLNHTTYPELEPCCQVKEISKTILVEALRVSGG